MQLASACLRMSLALVPTEMARLSASSSQLMLSVLYAGQDGHLPFLIQHKIETAAKILKLAQVV